MRKYRKNKTLGSIPSTKILKLKPTKKIKSKSLMDKEIMELQEKTKEI